MMPPSKRSPANSGKSVRKTTPSKKVVTSRRSVSTKVVAEEAFLDAWNLFGLPGDDLYAEYKWYPSRQWRFDFAFPSQKIAVEIEGQGGGHSTVKAVRDDVEKYNLALALDWKVFRFPAADIKTRNEYGESLLEDFVRLLVSVMMGWPVDE